MDDKQLLIEEPSKKKASVLPKLIIFAIGLLFIANVLIIILYFTNYPFILSTGTENNCDKNEIAKSDVGVSNKTGWAEAGKYIELGIDFNAKPCDDFYQFVCGKYQNGSSLKSLWYGLMNKAIEDLKNAALNFTVNENSPRAMKQAMLIFDKCMNISSSGRQNINYTLLAPFVENLGGWPLVFQNLSDPDWNPFSLMGILSSLTINNIFSVDTLPNWKDHDKGNMIFIGEADTLISKKSYKERGPQAGRWIREDIEDFAQKMAKFYDIKLDKQQLDNDVDLMLLIDYRLAMAKGPPFWEEVNFTKVYNEFDVKSAQKKWPDIDWKQYLSGVAADNINPEIVVNKSFNILKPKFVDILSVLPMSAGKGARHAQNYLMYRFISGGYRLLPGYQEKHRKLEKEKGKKPWETWQRGNVFIDSPHKAMTCFGLVQNYLPWVVARVYVDKSFNTMPGKPRDKLRMMTELVLDGFKEMIKGTPWMDEKTKFGAYEKIFNVQKNMAYPEWIMDDELLDARHPESHLNILEDDNSFVMYIKLIRFATWFKWHKFTEPVNRAEFSSLGSMPPYAVNAWYQPWYNSITFPAAFLHKPFFHVEFPMAVNLAALGAVMGHELVHGFDNRGSQFDDIGRLITWITHKSYVGYNKMAQCLIKQYDGYCYPKYDNICINGSFTLGENMADNGGLGAAYLAYKSYVEKFGAEPRMPGSLSKYTMDQVFFMAYGMLWCEDATHDPTWQIKGDVHSPGKYRVLGTLQNFPPFAKAFKCKKGSGMAPKKTCKGWWR